MNNTIKYILICLAASATPLFANACILAGGTAEDCETYCETQADYNICMEGATPPNSHDTSTTVTGQTDQPAS
jgi:hypothetical protein